MVRSAAGKVMWVGRATVFLVGLAVILALVFGVATTALGANGKPFLLGKWNAATALTKLTGNVNGAAMQVVNPNAGANDTALDLRVQAGEAPMRVNSNTRVANLNAASAGRADSAASADNATNAGNADKLDNKDSTEIGVNGLERATTFSASNSVSPKSLSASCPSGKVVVGTGFDINGGKTGFSPDALANVVIDEVSPTSSYVFVSAYEEEATTANWDLRATAICAKAP